MEKTPATPRRRLPPWTRIAGLTVLALLTLVQPAPSRAQGDDSAFNARMLLDFGNPEEAEQMLDRLIGREPDNRFLYEMRGSARSERGNLKGAFEDYSVLVRLAPEYGTGWYGLGYVAAKMKRGAEALGYFDKAIRYDGDALFYHARGRCRLDLGDVRGATGDFEKALELNPELAEARGSLEEARKRAGGSDDGGGLDKPLVQPAEDHAPIERQEAPRPQAQVADQPPVDAPAPIQAAMQPGQSPDVVQSYMAACRFLAAARMSALAGEQTQAFGHWGNGLKKLIEVRREASRESTAGTCTRCGKEVFPFAARCPDCGGNVLPGKQTYGGLYQNLEFLTALPVEYPVEALPAGTRSMTNMRVAWQSLCAHYAPWGLDLTYQLMQQGGPIAPGKFDLAVVDLFGTRDFCDVPMHVGPLNQGAAGLPWQPFVGALIRRAAIDDAKAEGRVVLRFFSPRVMTQSTYEWALDWSDTTLTWGPAIWGLAKVALYGETGGIGLVLDVGLAVLDAAKDWWVNSVNADGETWAIAEFSNADFGLAVPNVITFAQRQGLLACAERPSLAEWKQGVLLGMLGYVVTLARADQGVGFLEEARRASSVTGYLEEVDGSTANVAPILVQIFAVGPPAEAPFQEDYPLFHMGEHSLRVDYDRLYAGDDTHRNLLTGTLAGTRFPRDLPLAESRPNTVGRVDCAPFAQTIKWTLSRETVELLMQERGVSGDWTDASFRDMGVRFQVGYRDPSGKEKILDLPGLSTDHTQEGRVCQILLFSPKAQRGMGMSQMQTMGFPVAEIPDLRLRYSLTMLTATGRKIAEETVDFTDRTQKGLKSFARGRSGGALSPEQEIYRGILPRESKNKFPSVGMGMNLAYLYRVWGTIARNGEGFEDIMKFELETEKASWQGLSFTHSAPIEDRSKMVPQGTNPLASEAPSGNREPTPVPVIGSEDYRITVDQNATMLTSLEFSARVDSPEKVTRNRFVFQNVPRRATVDLGPDGGQVLVFWLKGEEMQKYSLVCEAGGEGDSYETDPETGKSVTVRGKSKLTSATWKDSYVLVTLSTFTLEELRSRVKQGILSEEAVEKAFDQELAPLMERVRGGRP